MSWGLSKDTICQDKVYNDINRRSKGTKKKAKLQQESNYKDATSKASIHETR